MGTANQFLHGQKKLFQDEIDKVFESFFMLDDLDQERDLFCTMTTLERGRGPRKKARDLFFRIAMRRWGAKKECWYERLARWELHIDRYCDVVSCDSNPAPQKGYFFSRDGELRIRIIRNMLGAMDSRFSMLLGVNSLLAGFIGVSLKETNDLFNQSGLWANIYLEWIVLVLMICALMLALVRSFFNVWYSVRGFRRVIWGDMVEHPNAGAAEQEHSRFLIASLARRTNMFRIVSESTRAAIRAFMFFVAIASAVVLSFLFSAAKADVLAEQNKASISSIHHTHGKDYFVRVTPTKDGYEATTFDATKPLRHYVIGFETSKDLRSNKTPGGMETFINEVTANLDASAP